MGSLRKEAHIQNGSLEVNEARRLKQLEEENRRLNKLLADTMLEKEAIQAVL